VSAWSTSHRELAYAGVFGAVALLLPVLFHLVYLGHVFMPMYLPLVALAFFVRPPVAVTTSVVTPLISGVLTGMPPFYPPVAPMMSIELGLASLAISAVCTRWPRANPWLVLVPVLLAGRVLYLGLVYAFALLIDLPPAFYAGASLIKGWPGVILMIIVLPPVVLGQRRLAAGREGLEPEERRSR
jgi:hypothetical protein